MSIFFEIVNNDIDLDDNGYWSFTTFYIDASMQNITIKMSENVNNTYYEFIRLDNTDNDVNIVTPDNDPYLTVPKKRIQYITYIPNTIITYQTYVA